MTLNAYCVACVSHDSGVVSLTEELMAHSRKQDRIYLRRREAGHQDGAIIRSTGDLE